MVFIAGEISTSAYVDMQKIARNTIKDIGYCDSNAGFDYKTCAVLSAIDEQSDDIAVGVNKQSNEEQGAGDQGMMFGFACSETPTYMPAPIFWAHKLSQKLSELRKNKEISFLRPDGKTQLSIEYVDDKPIAISNVVISAQHSDDVKLDELVHTIKNKVIHPILEDSNMFDENMCKIHINATGRFVIGGPMGDCGLTGRKIIQDTYGGMGRHGGGAFSGKDPSKVDRSAAYMARYIAKNIVATQLAEKCEVQISYCIGVAEPVSLFVSTFGTGKVPDKMLAKAVTDVFDLRPYHISKKLGLLRPIYKKTSCYGHFGRELPEFSWEKTDAVKDIMVALKV
jgi:S-adenosylmethionine synthetase